MPQSVHLLLKLAGLFFLLIRNKIESADKRGILNEA